MIADLLPWIQTEILPLLDQAPSAAFREGATCLQVSDFARDALGDRVSQLTNLLFLEQKLVMALWTSGLLL